MLSELEDSTVVKTTALLLSFRLVVKFAIKLDPFFYSQVTFDFGCEVLLPISEARSSSRVLGTESFQAIRSIKVHWEYLWRIDQRLLSNNFGWACDVDVKHLARL
jgi:hypothetical protein